MAWKLACPPAPVQVRDGDRGTFGREAVRIVPPDASAAAGDEHDPAVEPSGRHCSPNRTGTQPAPAEEARAASITA
jgi:hypothetical protein